VGQHWPDALEQAQVGFRRWEEGKSLGMLLIILATGALNF